MTDLVLLHGGSHGSWCWTPLLEVWADQPGPPDRILALDMPGCGTKRGRDVSSETLQSITAELNRDITAAGFRNVVLVGHSIAGMLLPMMIAADPSLFAQVIYLSTSVPNEGESVMTMMGASVHGQDPEHVGFPLDPATTSPSEMARAMFAPDMTPQQVGWLMREVSQDVTPPAVAFEPATRAGYAGLVSATYIVTLRDPILPPQWQRRFAGRVGCTTILEIDTPHEPFITHPLLLAETLHASISRV